MKYHLAIIKYLKEKKKNTGKSSKSKKKKMANSLELFKLLSHSESLAATSQL